MLRVSLINKSGVTGVTEGPMWPPYKEDVAGCPRKSPLHLCNPSGRERGDARHCPDARGRPVNSKWLKPELRVNR